MSRRLPRGWLPKTDSVGESIDAPRFPRLNLRVERRCRPHRRGRKRPDARRVPDPTPRDGRTLKVLLGVLAAVLVLALAGVLLFVTPASCARRTLRSRRPWCRHPPRWRACPSPRRHPAAPPRSRCSAGLFVSRSSLTAPGRITGTRPPAGSATSASPRSVPRRNDVRLPQHLVMNGGHSFREANTHPGRGCAPRRLGAEPWGCSVLHGFCSSRPIHLRGRRVGRANERSCHPGSSGSASFLLAESRRRNDQVRGVTKPSEVGAAKINGPFNPPRSAGNLVLDPARTPLAAYGFSGVGSKFGKWTQHKGVRTGNWVAYVGLSNGVRSPLMPAKSLVLFDRTATVTLVSIARKG